MKAQNHDAPLTALYGIGEVTATSLIEAGIETCQDMASANTHEVTAAIDVSEEQAQDYINDAKVTIGHW